MKTKINPVKRFWDKVDKEGPIHPYDPKCGKCWLWKANKDCDGYGRLQLGKTNVKASRFSWEVHYGPIANGLFVLHTCDNPECTNPKHLYLGTDADNKSDMVARGRQTRCFGDTNGTRLHPETVAKGIGHYAAKITDIDVLVMRDLYETGKYSLKLLASEFGISYTQVWKIVNYRKWKHV